jgi:hypothetical protein
MGQLAVTLRKRYGTAVHAHVNPDGKAQERYAAHHADAVRPDGCIAYGATPIHAGSDRRIQTVTLRATNLMTAEARVK